MARVLFTTVGSLGDLFPYLALAAEMQRRGHRATIRTNRAYKERVESCAIEFHPIRPDFDFFDPEFRKRALDEMTGARFLLRDTILPRIRESYEDLLGAARDADLLVTHVLSYSGPLVAEKTGMPWISTVLAPLSFFSYEDSPPVASTMIPLRERAPWLNAFINRVARRTTHSWNEPVYRLRRELGLKHVPEPIYDGQHSPTGVLALFSPLLAKPQRDWPPQTKVTGFALYNEAEPVPAALREFLAAGEPPVVFTLGSTHVTQPGRFYEESIKAVRRLGVRAVLLDGEGGEGTLIDPTILSLSYAPHSYIFPKASVTVHSGGIGTCARAMLAGHPMLVVPHAYDQPDNAFRLKRLGVARIIRPKIYNAAWAVREIATLLNDQNYRTNAERVAKIVNAEEGVRMACDALEAAL